MERLLSLVEILFLNTNPFSCYQDTRMDDVQKRVGSYSTNQLLLCGGTSAQTDSSRQYYPYRKIYARDGRLQNRSRGANLLSVVADLLDSQLQGSSSGTASQATYVVSNRLENLFFPRVSFRFCDANTILVEAAVYHDPGPPE